MESFVLWTPLRQTGLEQLHLVEDEIGVVADGLVLRIEQAIPFRFWYQVRTDSDWHVRECFFQIGGEQGRRIWWSTDGRGRWTDASGTAYSALDGCLDIDISCTPFTNTLPIRRLALTPGERADILVAYLSVPELSIRPVRQRYTCLSRTASGWLYRYERLETGTTFDLLVDEKALVVDYPGIWKRAETNPPGDVIPNPPRAILEGLLASGPILTKLPNSSFLGSLWGIGMPIGRGIRRRVRSAKQGKARSISPGCWMGGPSRTSGSFPRGKTCAVACP